MTGLSQTNRAQDRPTGIPLPQRNLSDLRQRLAMQQMPRADSAPPSKLHPSLFLVLWYDTIPYRHTHGRQTGRQVDQPSQQLEHSRDLNPERVSVERALKQWPLTAVESCAACHMTHAASHELCLHSLRASTLAIHGMRSPASPWTTCVTGGPRSPASMPCVSHQHSTTNTAISRPLPSTS